jgi:hypothetical protein
MLNKANGKITVELMLMLRIVGLHFKKINISISNNTKLGSFQLKTCEMV